ncbi:hypothetical protein GCM10009779_13000 [Polymorphospora rubra]|uniref:Uncharacterized protein n=1 Tax=Polymorphospora rubra TaxID=338584 RepID=A0A810NBJ2_9ACTN|nr:hypothetical protein Prubr_59340 [Polymorphospora rubra]
MFFANAKDEVYLQIVRFSDMTSLARRWSGGQLVWAGHIGVSEFISEVVAMAEEVLVNSGGADSYADLWGGIEFPMDLLRTLRGVGDL